MKGLNRIINLIKFSSINKKKTIKKKLNKQEVNFIKILIKINAINYCKMLNKFSHILYLNKEFKLKIKTFFKKKYFILKKSNKIVNKFGLFVVSNSGGLKITTLKNFEGGLIVAKINKS